MVVGSIPTLGAASIAQLGERKTEDLEAPCSIHGRSNMVHWTSAGVVNGADLKSAGLRPRRFESFLVRIYFTLYFYTLLTITQNGYVHLCQILVELTVEFSMVLV